MMNRRAGRAVLIFVLLLSCTAFAPLEAKTTLRLGTVVPKGSAWHDTLLYLRQEWRRISAGEVDLRIYAGGVLGDETEMVRQVRAGRIQAAALSANGLSRIDRGVASLQIPLMLDSYEELDYVLDRIAPKLELRLEEQGTKHKVLFWTDGGWVRFFATKPVKTMDDIRDMRLFTSAGDAETEKLWKSFGFNVVPLSATDMLTSLQTGMIDAFDVPPLFAMFDGSFKEAPNMLDLKIAPLIGGVVVSKRAWDGIPAEYRDNCSRPAGGRREAAGRDSQVGSRLNRADEEAGTQRDRARPSHARRLAVGGRGNLPEASRQLLPGRPVRRGPAPARRIPQIQRGLTPVGARILACRIGIPGDIVGIRSN